MPTANKPTPEQLCRLLHYNPLTGDLHWRINHNNRKAGDEAGTIRKDTGRDAIAAREQGEQKHFGDFAPSHQ